MKISKTERQNTTDYILKKVTLNISEWELGAILEALRYTHDHTSDNVDIYDTYINIVNGLRGEEKMIETSEMHVSTIPNTKTTQPDYYKTANGEDLIWTMQNGLLDRIELIGFLEGNIYKYLKRWRHKKGLEDLLKAKTYLDRLIKITEEGTNNAQLPQSR